MFEFHYQFITPSYCPRFRDWLFAFRYQHLLLTPNPPSTTGPKHYFLVQVRVLGSTVSAGVHLPARLPVTPAA